MLSYKAQSKNYSMAISTCMNFKKSKTYMSQQNVNFHENDKFCQKIDKY